MTADPHKKSIRVVESAIRGVAKRPFTRCGENFETLRRMTLPEPVAVSRWAVVSLLLSVAAS